MSITPPTSSYVKYLPAVLWEDDPPSNQFSLGTMLCPFEKILTGIDASLDGGILIEHGNNAVMTVVTQSVTGGPLPQSVTITPGTGSAFVAGSSYTYNGATPEVINVLSVNANTISAVIRQNHAINQTIVNSSGVHDPIQAVIANLVTLYGAWSAPADFLDWLAQWIALQLPTTWDEYQRRSVIANIVGIYAQRGTKPGLYEFFSIYALSPRRPRLVIDNDDKVLFITPQAGTIIPATPLVSQMPLVTPHYIALDGGGYMLVCDAGTGTGVDITEVNPSLWRISTGGAFDWAAGKGVVPATPLNTPVPPAWQPFQPATLNLAGPVAVAADPVNGGAYLIDLYTDYTLYRLTDPQVGTVTLSGTPTTGQTATIAVNGTAYALNETTGSTNAQATTWATALNGMTPFNADYHAAAAGGTIVITALAGAPNNDLEQCVSSTSLELSASGPAFGASAVFADDTSLPAWGIKYPVGLVVNAAGQPVILDRGAKPPATSKTAIVVVDIAAGPVYSGVSAHAFAQIIEPLSFVQLADGSYVVADAVDQSSANPALLYHVNSATWAITNLLSGVSAANNPLVAPTGVAEVDAHHLIVVDAGLRPFVPNPAAAFTAIVAQQPAVYSVDLSVSPAAIARVSDQQSMVYPRGMVGDGSGTFYICDPGMPPLPGYDSQAWRATPQQCSVVVHFQGDPTLPVFSVTLAGTPTSGENGQITIGGTTYKLPETGGDSTTTQAATWASILNATDSFNALYIAGSLGNILNIYTVPGTTAVGTTMSVASSAHLQLTDGLLLGAVTLNGTPTTGDHVVINVGPPPGYTLDETTGFSLATQASTWAGDLNSTAAFAVGYSAVATDNVIAIYYAAGNVANNMPFTQTSALPLTLALDIAPYSIGSVTLWGTPTTGENGQITVGDTTEYPYTTPYTLSQTSGNTVAQQASQWCTTLNATAGFGPKYSCSSAGASMNFFATTVPSAGVGLSAVSSAHLQLTAYSELQNRTQFLQSITDVVNDEIPAQARWFLASEQSPP